MIINLTTVNPQIGQSALNFIVLVVIQQNLTQDTGRSVLYLGSNAYGRTIDYNWKTQNLIKLTTNKFN